MVRIIGAGFPRTGTSSMKAALERLGYGPCHHMFEVYKNPAQVGRWVRAASAITADGSAGAGARGAYALLLARRAGIAI